VRRGEKGGLGGGKRVWCQMHCDENVREEGAAERGRGQGWEGSRSLDM